MTWDMKSQKKKSVFPGTGTCFDVTDCSKMKERPGDPIEKYKPELDISAFSCQRKIEKKTPQLYTKKKSGFGGMLYKPAQKKEIPDFPDENRENETPVLRAITKTAFSRRANPRNTLFRKHYERGDLPCQIDHGAVQNRVVWKHPVVDLDFHYYLPLFFDGLREIQEPYATMAEKGIIDMINVGGSLGKVAPVVPQLIIPIKSALNTRDRRVAIKVLTTLQALVKCDEPDSCLVGKSLVPYFRQILPVLNIFVTQKQNLGDQMDYQRDPTKNLGEIILETLEILERHGGPDAFVNIRFLVPTYQSVIYR